MPKYLTKEKYEELKKELEYLKTEKRKEIAELIKHTASFGDLKENFAYQQAKEEQAMLERKIKEIEEIIRDAVILKENKGTEIQLGSVVYLKNIETQKTERFHIVDPIESNPDENKISFNSPLGKELIGKKVGDKILVKIPAGTKKYKIEKIE